MSEQIVKADHYRSYYEVAKKIKNVEERCAFYDALDAYRFDGIIPVNLPLVADIAFTAIKPNLDADMKRKCGGAPVGNTNAKKKVEPIEEQPTVKEETTPEEPVKETETTSEPVKNNSNTIEENKEEQPKTTTETTSKQLKNNLKTTQNNRLNEVVSKKTNNEYEYEDVYDNDNVIAAQVAAGLTPAKKSDIELVESRYLDNYKKLYEQGILSLPEPKIDYACTRKLIKGNLAFYGLDKTLLGLERSVTDGWCLQSGYSLATIMAANCMNKLINDVKLPQKGEPVLDTSEKLWL